MRLVNCLAGQTYTRLDGTYFTAPCTGIFVDRTSQVQEDWVHYPKSPESLYKVDRLYYGSSPAESVAISTERMDATLRQASAITRLFQAIEQERETLAFRTGYSYEDEES